jgi:hypothetical protein
MQRLTNGLSPSSCINLSKPLQLVTQGSILLHNVT